MALAEHSLPERPLTLSFVRELHSVLLKGVRGDRKGPGHFRTEQNWIGKARCEMNEARFIPPSPLILTDGLENWEQFLSNEDVDPVLQVALAHAQFEILHPFLDGNGRIGRILIPLLFFRHGVLFRPMFYLSEYLEANRTEYYDRLLAITEEGDWEGWIIFFAGAVKAQSLANKERTLKIFALYDELKKRFIEATSSKFAVTALDAFFMTPILDTTQFAKYAKTDNRVTANTLLKHLAEAGLVWKIKEASGSKPAVYALETLIAIAEGRD